MKVLIVAMHNSIHTIRWIEQIHDNDDIKVYLIGSAFHYRFHKKLDKLNVNLIIPLKFIRKLLDFRGGRISFSIFSHRYGGIRRYLNKNWYEEYLSKSIDSIKPDVIHTLETQSAGYLLNRAIELKKPKHDFVWWHTNWGSDLYMFGRFDDHKDKIKSLLARIDLYSCECQRDVELAKDFGFKGKTLPVYPNAGGFDIKKLEGLASGTIPSDRKVIMVKGYQGWAGRALVAFRAISRAHLLLKEFEIVIYTNTKSADIQIASKLLRTQGLNVTLVPEGSSHEDILRWHGKARISIGLSISDGLSTSMLEAMAMGSFPIQSNTTGGKDEWLRHGINGLLVHPEEPQEVEKAIRLAIEDDDLVNKASVTNIEMIKSKANYKDLQSFTIDSYKQAFNLRKKKLEREGGI